jgi:hypothetical protein
MSNQLGQAQTGTLSSIPKVCKVSGDDNMKMLWKNMGNNHNTPFLWGQTVTFSGTSYVVASGIKFHGSELASVANVTITPLTNFGTTARVYVEKDTALNKISIRSTATISASFDVQIMLGSTDPDISSISCRGNTGASPTYP